MVRGTYLTTGTLWRQTPNDYGASEMLEMEIEKIRSLGLNPERLKDFQVLCLPENFDSVTTREDLLDTSETADLSKHLREAGLQCANSFDLGIQARVIERRGMDLWLGVLWILDNLALPVFVSVVAGLLLKRLRSRNSKETTVHVKIRLQANNQMTNIKYDGDSDTFIKILQGIAAKRKGPRGRAEPGKGRRRGS